MAPPGTGGLFPGYDLEQEARIMRALSEGSDVPAPRVLFSETDGAVLGGPFLVMERIEGRVPSDDPPYSKEGWVVDLEPDQQAAMMDNAVATVAPPTQGDTLRQAAERRQRKVGAALATWFMENPAYGELAGREFERDPGIDVRLDDGEAGGQHAGDRVSAVTDAQRLALHRAVAGEAPLP